MNHLYFGDCLDVLRDLKENYPQPFIDLVYIDPPFNSKRNYTLAISTILISCEKEKEHEHENDCPVISEKSIPSAVNNEFHGNIPMLSLTNGLIKIIRDIVFHLP